MSIMGFAAILAMRFAKPSEYGVLFAPACVGSWLASGMLLLL
jgi:hypothetical protein